MCHSSVPGRCSDVVCAPASVTADRWNRQLLPAGRPTTSVAAHGSMPISEWLNSIAMSKMDASWSGEREAVGEERREEGGMDKRHMV